jgi:peptide/nickel transport system substrate-binding protein
MATNKLNRTRGLFSGLILAAYIFSACSPRPTNLTETRPIVMIASDQPGPADPAENWSFGGAAYLPQVYDTLFRFVGEKAPKLEPLLAAEIPSLENGGVTRFGVGFTGKLKPHLTFHDGSPLNAAAVVFSYQRIQSLKLGPNGISADWIEQVERVDDLTVRFTLKQPFADFLNSMGSMWGNYIVNPVVVNQHLKPDPAAGGELDQGHAWLLEHDAGSGPYTLAAVDHDANQITLQRYPAYWGGWSNSHPVGKLVIRWLADANAARALLEKGQADILVNPPAEDFAALSGAAGFASQKSPSIMQYYLGLNGSQKPLDDVRVRQAMQYSFDKERMIHEIFKDNMLPMTSAVGPGYPETLPAQSQFSFDLEKASVLLKEAGYENGFDLTINVVHLWPNDSAVVEAWKVDLAKIGVKVQIHEVNADEWSKAWFDRCAAGSTPGLGQISTMTVGGDYPSAWEVLAQVYPTPRLGGGQCSAVYINNPLINNLSNKLVTTFEPKSRQALFQSLYDALAEDSGAIWIGQAVDTLILRSSLRGYRYFFSMGGNYIPLAEMTLQEN